jgi:hypothetical protein
MAGESHRPTQLNHLPLPEKLRIDDDFHIIEKENPLQGMMRYTDLVEKRIIPTIAASGTDSIGNTPSCDERRGCHLLLLYSTFTSKKWWLKSVGPEKIK